MENLVNHTMLSSYRHKKVFVTGHTGFKGSWLCLLLQALECRVKGYALPPDTTPNHFSLLQLPIESELNDIRDAEALKLSVQAFQPEIIFHLAAQPLVIPSYHDPLTTYATNVMGTAHLLEAARHCPSVKAVVVITTDKVYENKERDEGYAETDPLGGYDPYSASKAAAEIVTQSYLRSYFHPDAYGQTHTTLIASARGGNVIGGGDWAPYRIVPDIYSAVVHNTPLTLRYPQSTRPWQHVLDCLWGYLLLGEKLLNGERDFSGPWNFGPTEQAHIPVSEVVRMACEFFPELQVEILDHVSLHEAGKLHLNISKATSRLGWRPRYTDQELFTETFRWYAEYHRQGKVLSAELAEHYLRQQLATYAH